MIVVGEREVAQRAVSLRRLRGEKSQVMGLESMLQLLKDEPIPA